jgi:hypothetical protein
MSDAGAGRAENRGHSHVAAKWAVAHSKDGHEAAASAAFVDPSTIPILLSPDAMARGAQAQPAQQSATAHNLQLHQRKRAAPMDVGAQDMDRGGVASAPFVAATSAANAGSDVQHRTPVHPAQPDTNQVCRAL